MDTARKTRKIDNKAEIKFITSLIEYALEGYEIMDYIYLIKPVKYKDLKTHILKCIKEIDLKINTLS